MPQQDETQVHAAEEPVEDPLLKFPCKSDRISKILHSSTHQRHASARPRDQQRYVMQGYVDPQLGHDESPDRQQLTDTNIKRGFRRVATTGLFEVPEGAESLRGLSSSSPRRGVSYVLLEAHRLTELLRLEEVLRGERAWLGRQCADLLPSLEGAAPNIPLAATRAGIASVCGAEMGRAAALLGEVDAAWTLYSRQNHYDRPHIYLHNAFLEHCPVSERIVKERILRQGVADYRRRYDRDSMSYEDERSGLVGRYQDARERGRDYEVYCILASRYGVYSYERFIAEDGPGHHYLRSVQRGARLWQRQWGRFWHSTTRFRGRHVTRIQTAWRRHRSFRRYYPIIRMMLKMKTRLRKMGCLQKWRAYVELCRHIYDVVVQWRDYRLPEQLAFKSWRDDFLARKHAREAVVGPYIQGKRRAFLSLLLDAWKEFVFRLSSLRRTKKTISRYPHFYVWRSNVREVVSLRRRRAKADASLGRFVTLFVKAKMVRRRFRRAEEKVRGFMGMFVAKHVLRFRHNLMLVRGFERHCAGRRRVEEDAALERERLRQERLTAFRRQREGLMMTELHAHLATADGALQLREAAKRDRHAPEAVRGVLEGRCGSAGRTLATHDFEAEHSPGLCFCHQPACHAALSTPEQYARHLLSDGGDGLHDAGVSVSGDEVAALHLLLLDPALRETFATHIARAAGLCRLVFLVELWAAVEAWKYAASGSEQFWGLAVALHDTFLAESAEKAVHLGGSACPPALLQLLGMASRGDAGAVVSCFETREATEQSVFERVFFMPARRYLAWVPPPAAQLVPLLVALQWEAFRVLLAACWGGSIAYRASEEWAAHRERALAEERDTRARQLAGYRDARRSGRRAWAADFRAVEIEGARLALLAIDVAAGVLLDDLVSELLGEALAARGQREDQCAAQSVAAVQEVILEELLLLLAPAMLTVMLAVPSYRVYALQFFKGRAGELTALVAGMRRQASMGVSRQQRQAERQLDLLVRVTPLARAHEDLEATARRIQSCWRRHSALRRVRGVFAAAWVKKFDPTAQQCYYVNKASAQTQWSAPLLARKLFRKAKW